MAEKGAGSAVGTVLPAPFSAGRTSAKTLADPAARSLSDCDRFLGFRTRCAKAAPEGGGFGAVPLVSASTDVRQCLTISVAPPHIQDSDPLKGDRAGRYAVRLTANVRVTFGWDDNGATDVDVED